jgi:hypothetical protein
LRRAQQGLPYANVGQRMWADSVQSRTSTLKEETARVVPFSGTAS